MEYNGIYEALIPNAILFFFIPLRKYKLFINWK